MSELDLAGLLGALSADDIGMIKKAAAGLLGGVQNGEQNTAKASSEAVPEAEKTAIPQSFGAMGLPDLASLAPLASIMGELSKKDERTQFISSLKPLLSEGRQAKADEAIKLIRLLDLIPKLHEQGIL